MTIVMLDDDGKEVIRINPACMTREFREQLVTALGWELDAINFTLANLERIKPGMLFQTPKAEAAE